MFSLKHKTLLVVTGLCIIFASISVATPRQVHANHDGCPTSADAAETCIQNKRNTANEKCFESFAGQNDKIAQCVRDVTAHYTFSGPRADAPPLPDTSSTAGTEPVDEDCKIVDKNNCQIINRLVDFINILTALVGIVAAIMLTVWGIQYSVSRDNPQMVASARLRILQTVLAVIMYLFVYAFLQWLVPGGVL